MWDRLLPVLSLAYNTCPHRATGLAPFDLLIPRRMPNLTVEELAGVTPLKGTADGSPLLVKRAIINGLKRAIPAVCDTLTRYQARYKRAWDGKVRPKNKELVVGDFVYLRSHRGGHKLSPKALGPFEILDTDGTFFVIDQGEGEGRVKSDHVTAAPRPDLGPAQQPHRLTQSPLPAVADPAHEPSWEIDRLLDIRHATDGDIIAKVRWSTFGPADDSWEPISGLPKHLVKRLAKRKRFTIPDGFLCVTPTLLVSEQPRTPWKCVALQLHVDPHGDLWADLHWASPRGNHDETVPARWAASLLAPHPAGPRPARGPHARKAFRALDRHWGPHTADPFAAATPSPLAHPRRLAPTSRSPGPIDAFSVDWTQENCWVNPPFALLGAVFTHLAAHPSDATVIAPRWQHQPWWATAEASCVDRVQLDPEYARTVPSPPTWRLVAFRFARPAAAQRSPDSPAPSPAPPSSSSDVSPV